MNMQHISMSIVNKVQKTGLMISKTLSACKSHLKIYVTLCQTGGNYKKAHCIGV